MGSHPVYACRVECPLRGNIDVDRCFGRLRFQAVVPAQSGLAIQCDSPDSRRPKVRRGRVGGLVVVR